MKMNLLSHTSDVIVVINENKGESTKPKTSNEQKNSIPNTL